MFELTLIPAYGRVLNSKPAVWTAWRNGLDFQIASVGRDQGRYINNQDASQADLACLLVRYGKRLEKSCTINLIKNRII
jgi:hypothetical protein